LFTREPELMVFEVLFPQSTKIVPGGSVVTEKLVMVLPDGGVGKVQILAEDKTLDQILVPFNQASLATF
jgi:hypothetical protein